jgi:hypothetical protein
MPSLARLMWLRSAPARASMHGRSAAPMYVKYIGEDPASPSRPDQHSVLPLIQAVAHQEQKGGVFKIPVAAAEHRSPPRGLRETFDRARGALFSARRVRRAPGRREARRVPRVVCAAKRPGRISFGDLYNTTCTRCGNRN